MASEPTPETSEDSVSLDESATINDEPSLLLFTFTPRSIKRPRIPPNLILDQAVLSTVPSLEKPPKKLPTAEDRVPFKSEAAKAREAVYAGLCKGGSAFPLQRFATAREAFNFVDIFWDKTEGCIIELCRPTRPSPSQARPSSPPEPTSTSGSSRPSYADTSPRMQ
jgi:hypothetical protein